GELFIRMAKEGSTVSGLMDSFATAVSLALQHGVPLKLLCDKFQHTRFDPAGFTGNQEIPIAKNVMDYIFRLLDIRFVSGKQYPLFKDMVLPAAHPPAAVSEHAAISEGSAPSAHGLAGQTQHSAFSPSETMPPQGGLAGSQKPEASGPQIVDRGLYH